MSHHEIAPGQKTQRRVIASRRPRLSVTLASSAPPHRADTSGYIPPHPLPTRRAGVASFITALVPDALFGNEPAGRAARAAMQQKLEAMPWLGMLAVAAMAFNFLAYAVIVGGVR